MQQTGKEEILRCDGPESGVRDGKTKRISLFGSSDVVEGITAA